MPRNGSGNYSIPNTFTANTLIVSADVNENNSDIGTEITGSLPRNGVAAMQAPLPLQSGGSASAPTLVFDGDTNLGLYRAAADTLAIAAAGADVVVIATASVTITGALTASGAIIGATGLLPFPSGTLMLFQQTSAPTGWTKQTTHDDKALRVVSGTASSGGTSPFSTVFGLTATSSHVLSTAEMPAHTHSVTAPSSNINVQQGTADTTVSAPTAGTATGSTGGGGGHTHPIELRVNYVDLIIAARD